MKMIWSVSNLLLFFFPICALAGWEVAKPQTTVAREPFFQAGKQQPVKQFRPVRPVCTTPVLLPPATHRSTFLPVANPTSIPNQYATLSAPTSVYAMSISGSLKENMERIMGRYHWKVIWKAPYDFNFDGRVMGSSLPNVVEKLLRPFPLQAVMYMSNRTVAIVPRYRT